MARALEVTAPRFPVPWCFAYAAGAQRMFGEDWWPYGVDKTARRSTLFSRGRRSSASARADCPVDELFAPTTMTAFRV